ncbi:MAG: hypothetical protein EA428_09000 [Spirochaetaceae bacterium]|nr:MAG: hypothetical protein EA428_09000 [Spirochaetaceae bacterium]
MSRSCQRVLIILSLFILAATVAHAADPAWLRYQRGLAAYEEGELGLALRHFRGALEQQARFPEAEAGIGMILAQEGAFGPAIRHLSSALEQANELQIPEEHFRIRYTMAEIHELQGDRREYERTLERIVDEDRNFRSPQQATLRNARRRVFLDNGFDRMLELYRLEPHPSLDAHRLLGVHYLRSGEYSAAFEHLLTASLQASTRMIAELRHTRPVYEYDNLHEFLDKIESDRTLAYLVSEMRYYELLYLLAAASYGVAPDLQHSTDLWQILVERPSAGIWSRRAHGQLRDPRANALIDY